MTTTPVDSPVTPREAQRSDHRPRVVPVVYFVLLVTTASVIPWRSNNYFSGSFDPVDLAKAGLLLLAFLGSLVLAASTRARREVPIEPAFFFGAYLVATVLGAGSSGNLVPTLVIAVRMLLLLATVVMLVMYAPPNVVLPCLVGAVGTVMTVAIITGLGSIVTEGRLAGGIPPMHPNEIAFESTLVLTWVISRMAQGTETWLHLAVGAFALGALVLSGSRTSLLMLAPTVLILVVTATAVRARTVLLAAALLPTLVWVTLGTDVLATLISRGEDASQLASLSNRTIAWQAALAPKANLWQSLFGSGLSTKQIPVSGQYWDVQILDSSWVSVLVQAGFVGLAICALWMVHTMIRVYQSSSRPLLGWQCGMVVLLASRGLLESGLFDSSTAFMVLACLAFGNGVSIVRGRLRVGLRLPRRAAREE